MLASLKVFVCCAIVLGKTVVQRFLNWMKHRAEV